MDNEITVLVKDTYENLHQQLLLNGFVIKEEYEMIDYYMINSSVCVNKNNILKTLQKYILVRNVVGIEKLMLCKEKEYSPNGDILKQKVTKCPILSIKRAITFLESINYKEILKLCDKCIVYINGKTELIVQIVNGDMIFIEMEQEPQYINKHYKTISELCEEINSYNLPIDKNNYFVKKAEILLRNNLK